MQYLLTEEEYRDYQNYLALKDKARDLKTEIVIIEEEFKKNASKFLKDNINNYGYSPNPHDPYDPYSRQIKELISGIFKLFEEACKKIDKITV